MDLQHYSPVSGRIIFNDLYRPLSSGALAHTSDLSWHILHFSLRTLGIVSML